MEEELPTCGLKFHSVHVCICFIVFTLSYNVDLLGLDINVFLVKITLNSQDVSKRLLNYSTDLRTKINTYCTVDFLGIVFVCFSE